MIWDFPKALEALKALNVPRTLTLKTKLRLIYLSEFFLFFHLFGGVLIPFFSIWGGLSLTQIMLLQAWFSFWIVIFEIPTGTLADVIGRKKTILLGLFAIGIGLFMYGLLQSFWWYLLAEMLWALSFSLFSGAKEALVYDTLIDHDSEDQSDRVFQHFKMSHLWGLMISAPLGGIIASWWGYQWVMLLMIIPILLSALMLLAVPEPKAQKEADFNDPTASPKNPVSSQNQPFLIHMKKAWKYFREHPYLGVMTFDMVTIWSLAFMFIWFQQVQLEQLGVDVAYFGWFTTGALLAQIGILKLYPYFESVLGSKKRLLTFTGLAPAVGFLLLAFFPSIPVLILALVLCTGFGLSRRTLYISYTNKHIPSSLRATVNSFINIGIHFVGFLIKPALGFLADYSLYATFLALGMACLVVVFFSRIEEKMLSPESVV